MIITLKRILRKISNIVKRNKLLISILIFVIVIIVNGALFYYSENVLGHNKSMTFFKALYWAIVTATTVGYGDIVPTTFLSRIITIETIFTGIATFTIMVSLVAEAFISRALRGMLGLGRVKKTDVLVIGYGEICREAIEELKMNRPDYRITWLIERRPREVPEDVNFIIGDPTEEQSLKRAGAESAKYVLICLGNDSKIIHTVLSLRKMNKRARIAAIAWSRRAQELLKEAGVAIVVPLRIIGRMLASAAFEPIVPIFLEQATTIRGAADLIEIDIDEEFHDKTIRDLVRKLESDTKKKHIPLMLCHSDGKTILAPGWDTRLSVGDRLLLLRINVESSELAKSIAIETSSS